MNEHKGSSKQRKNKYDNKFSRKNIDTLLSKITNEQLRQRFMLSQITSRTFVHVDDVLYSHSSIFIGGIAIKIISFTSILYNFKISGRYNKLSRELSQTPWFINGEKKVETSVQDLLCNPIAKAVKAECMF